MTSRYRIASETSGYDFQAPQANFLLLQKKQELVSQPEGGWKIGSDLNVSGSSDE